jgi:hypothetical protein
LLYRSCFFRKTKALHYIEVPSFLGLVLPTQFLYMSEPVVINVLRGKVATKVGTFLAKSMNLVRTFPHGHKLLSYRQSTYLVATFKKSSNLVPTLKTGTLVPTLYIL